MTGPARLVPPTASAPSAGSRRWAAAFQSRFFLALLLGLAWLGPGWWNRRALYALPLWDGIALLAWLLDLRSLPKPQQFTVSRRWTEPLSLDMESRVEIEVENHGIRRVLVDVEDDVPLSLSATLPRSTLAVPAGATAKMSYTIRPSVRGDVEAGRTFLRYHGPVRFAERWAVADVRQDVCVYPNLRDPERYTLYLLRSRQIEQEKRLRRQVGRGREFESLREYRESDEIRDVCWTATARRGKLISKVYQVERSQSVFLVVDAGRLMLARTKANVSAGGKRETTHGLGASVLMSPSTTTPVPTADQDRRRSAPESSPPPSAPPLTKLDYAVNAALSLAHVALHSGDTTGLVTYGRKLQSYLPAGRGAEHLRHLLEQLALVAGEPLEADHALAADSLLARNRRRSLVVWLTDLAETAATPEVIEAASRLLPRHLVLFAAVGEPELRALAGRRPKSPAEMYQYVAAQQMIHRRELLLRRMREQGALAMEFLPGQLSSEIVNHYLQIKWKGLL